MANENENANVAQGANIAKENENTTNNVVSNPSFESVQDICARLLKDKRNFMVIREITSVTSEQRTAKSGKAYTNVWLTLDEGVKRISVSEDGEIMQSLLGAIQVPANSVLLPMRKHRFYGRFVGKLEEYLNADAADIYFSGVKVQIFGQFVAADDITSGNPFIRNNEPYFTEERTADTYVYHIVAVDVPTDEITLAEYRELLTEIRAEAKAKLEAAKAAKAKASSVLASIGTDDNIPF